VTPARQSGPRAILQAWPLFVHPGARQSLSGDFQECSADFEQASGAFLQIQFVHQQVRPAGRPGQFLTLGSASGLPGFFDQDGYLTVLHAPSEVFRNPAFQRYFCFLQRFHRGT